MKKIFTTQMLQDAMKHLGEMSVQAGAACVKLSAGLANVPNWEVKALERECKRIGGG